MKYKMMGRTGVLISELCLGTMTFGNEADEKESANIFNTCRDVGINYYDTANNYNKGRSEEILGKLIKSCRDEIILSTKVTHKTGENINDIGSSRRHIMIEVEKSLKRLNTDRIDVYFIHQFDSLTPIEETMRALDDLVHQGKIIYLGVSNWSAWQIALSLGVSEKEQLHRFECIQPMYNLIKRQSEVEILPLAKAKQLSVLSYNPLAAGLLTGKYLKNDKPKDGRIVEKDLYNKRYGEALYYEIAERFCDYAKKINVHPATLALSWVLSNPDITSPLIGARNVEQLKASLAAVDFKMSPEMREEISKLSVEPPSATDRLEEKLDSHYNFRVRI